MAGLLETAWKRPATIWSSAWRPCALCEPVAPPRDSAAYRYYFCCQQAGNAEQLRDNEARRLQLYKQVSSLIRAYANIAGELAEAGYTPAQIDRIQTDVDHYSKVRDEIKLASGDYIDLKAYEPAMRYLIDTYIRADDSEKISAFDDLNLIQLIVERGPDAVQALPERVKKNEESVAETIENNVRKLIINESPIDPAYYERMSKLLDALIEQRRTRVLDYKEYLARIASLSQQVLQPHGVQHDTPSGIQTATQKALYNNLWQDEGLALQMDGAIRGSSQDGWKTSTMKTKLVRNAIRAVLKPALTAKAAGALPGYKPPLMTTRWKRKPPASWNSPSTSMTTESHSITVSGIRVQIDRKDIKNLHLGSTLPMAVRVAAPLLVTNDAVRLAVIDKLGWIRRQQNRLTEQPRQSVREMVNGESHYSWGDATGCVSRNRLGGTCGHPWPEQPGSVCEPRPDRTTARGRTGTLVPPAIEHADPALAGAMAGQAGVQVKVWGVKRMKTKWGSCNPATGRVWFNLELAKKPVQCLEYIVVHELIHLLVRRHNDQFMALMNNQPPKWHQQRDMLNELPLAHERW